MKRLKLSLRIQGLLLIGLTAAVIAVWLIGPLGQYRGLQSDIDALEQRVETHKARLANLPAPQLIGATVPTDTEDLSIPEIQQKVSSVLRQGDTRLRSLSPAQDTSFAELPAKQWLFEINGDPQAVEEMLQGLERNQSFFVPALSIEFRNARELRVSGQLLRLNGQLELPEMSQSESSFLDRNPFDIERKAYMRARQIEAAEVNVDITLIGISRTNGISAATLTSPQYGEQAVVIGDSYGAFVVSEIRGSDVELTDSENASRIVSLFEN